MSEDANIQAHPAAEKHHLQNLFNSCIDMLRDTKNAIVAQRPLPGPSGSNPIKFGTTWTPMHGRPVGVLPEDITLDYEKPSKILPVPLISTTRQIFHLNSGQVHSVVFSADGQIAATASTQPGPIKVIGLPRADQPSRGFQAPMTINQASSEFEVGDFNSSSIPISALGFHRNVKTLFAGDMDGVLKAFDASIGVSQGQMSQRQPGDILLNDPTLPISSIAVHPTNDYLLLGSCRSRMTTGKAAAHQKVVGLTAETVAAEGSAPLRLLDVRTGRTFVTSNRLFDHKGGVAKVDWSQSGNFAVSGGSDGVLAFWDGSSMKRVNAIKLAHGGFPMTSVYVMRNQNLILTSGLDGCGRIWDIRTGRELLRLGTSSEGGAIFSHSCAVSLYDERYVFVTAVPLEGPKEVKLFNATTAQRIELDLPIVDVYSMASSATDNYVVIGSLNGRAAVHEVKISY